jgi:hypothetical protein
VRKKAGVNKSWALMTFRTEEALLRCRRRFLWLVGARTWHGTAQRVWHSMAFTASRPCTRAEQLDVIFVDELDSRQPLKLKRSEVCIVTRQMAEAYVFWGRRQFS